MGGIFLSYTSLPKGKKSINKSTKQIMAPREPRPITLMSNPKQNKGGGSEPRGKWRKGQHVVYSPERTCMYLFDVTGWVTCC